MEDFGGRKFIFSLVILISGLILALYSKIDAKQFIEFTKWIAGFYVAGNVVSKFAK